MELVHGGSVIYGKFCALKKENRVFLGGGGAMRGLDKNPMVQTDTQNHRRT